MDYLNIINLYFISVILQALTICGLQIQEYSQAMTISNGYIVSEKLPTCENGKIKLLSYEYHHCATSHPCSKPLKTRLSGAAELVIHEMCSLKRTCDSLRFPTADLSPYTTTVINLTYQCLDQFTTFLDICANSTRTENTPVHLLYRNNAATYEECTCVIKGGMFSLSVSDVRLKSANYKNCSRSKLYVNHKRLTCNGTKADYESVFEQSVAEKMTASWVMFVTDSNFVEPEMVYLTLKPQGQVMISCQRKGRKNTPFKTEQSSTPWTVRNSSFIDKRGTQNKAPITAPFAIIVTACTTSVLYAVISLVAIALNRRKKRISLRKPESAGQEVTCSNPRQEGAGDDQRYTECMQYSQGACGFSPQTANVCRNDQTPSDTNKETYVARDGARYYDAGVFHAIYEQIQPELEYHDKEYLELDQRHM